MARAHGMVPPGKERQLSVEQIADIAAFMLECSTFPAGTSELAGEFMKLKQVEYLTEEL